MSTVKVRLAEDGSMVRVFPDGGTEPIVPQVDYAKLNATTEADIARHEAEDEVACAIRAGQYVRAVRRKVGLSQVMFARKLQIPARHPSQLGAGQTRPAGAGPRAFAHH